MLVFPQLASGAITQFPVEKRVTNRTLVTEAAEGHRLKLADPKGAWREWRLKLAGLDEAEWAAVDALFEAAEGRLRPFTFLDPFDNLLAWSEDLGESVWVKDELLQMTPGVADPAGGAAATRLWNAGGSAQRISQALAVPSDFRYSLSFYARSDGGARAVASIGSADRAFELGPAWKRMQHTAQSRVGEDQLSFSVAIEAGDTLELYGLQAEAQVGASAYKRTGARNGIHSNAYFAEDTLILTSNSAGEHSCTIRIRAAG